MKATFVIMVLFVAFVLSCIFCPRKSSHENFLVTVPESLTFDVETVDPAVLKMYDTEPATNFDLEAITRYSTAHPEAGNIELYTVHDLNIKAFVEDVASSRSDYAGLKTKYLSFVTAIMYHSADNTIMYYTVDKPWNLPSNASPFRDSAYRVSTLGWKLYIPKWTYSESDPGQLAIDPVCRDTLNAWKDTDDISIINRLERDTCMSKSNKIKFVGMVLLNYFKILHDNKYAFSDACEQFKSLANNIKNPELSRVLKEVNRICDDVTVVATPIDDVCVTAYDNATKANGTLDQTAASCFTTEVKAKFIDRLKKFLSISDKISIEYLESFYLVVDKVYKDTKSTEFGPVFKETLAVTQNTEAWKSLLDGLFKRLLTPVSVTVNGKPVTGYGLQQDGYKAPATDSDELQKSSSVIEVTLAAIYHIRTVVVKSVDSAKLIKYALSYEDPYSPGVFLDFDRVLYGPSQDNDVKIETLDIQTRLIRIHPLEWSAGVGFRIGFEGNIVKVQKCDQKISVCDHESKIASERSYSKRLSSQYDASQKTNNELLAKIDSLSAATTKLQSDLDQQKRQTELARNAKCPPQMQCLPPIALPPIG